MHLSASIKIYLYQRNVFGFTRNNVVTVKMRFFGGPAMDVRRAGSVVIRKNVTILDKHLPTYMHHELCYTGDIPFPSSYLIIFRDSRGLTVCTSS